MGYGGRGFKPPLSLHQFFLIDIAILSLFMTFSHYYRHIANITSMGVFKSRENRNLNCVYADYVLYYFTDIGLTKGPITLKGF